MKNDKKIDKALEELVWKELHICKYKEIQLSILLSRFKKREKFEIFIFWVAFVILLLINLINNDFSKMSVFLLLVLEIIKDVKSLRPTWLGTQYIKDLDKKLSQAILLTSDYEDLYADLPNYGDIAKAFQVKLKERSNNIFYMGENLPIELTANEVKEANREYKQYDKVNYKIDY